MALKWSSLRSLLPRMGAARARPQTGKGAEDARGRRDRPARAGEQSARGRTPAPAKGVASGRPGPAAALRKASASAARSDASRDDGLVEPGAFGVEDDWNDALEGWSANGGRGAQQRRRTTDQYNTRFQLPWLHRLALRHQVWILLSFVGISLASALGISLYDRSMAEMRGLQSEVIGDALMHAQRIAKATTLAVRGRAGAFEDMQDSTDYLNAVTKALTEGGRINSWRINAVSNTAQPAAVAMRKSWDETSIHVQEVLQHRKTLESFDSIVERLTGHAAQLQVAFLPLLQAVRQNKSLTSVAEAAQIDQLAMLAQLIATDLIRVRRSDGIRVDQARMLAEHLQRFRLVRDVLIGATQSPGLLALSDDSLRRALQHEAAEINGVTEAASLGLDMLTVVDRAQIAAEAVVQKSEQMSSVIRSLREQQDVLRTGTTSMHWLMIGAGLLVLIGLALLSQAYFNDADRRAFEAERQGQHAQRLEQEAKRVNSQNQIAILRLMNELQTVADGDLTMQATVSDDITGAIADSINYTVEALRDLVRRINETTDHVATACAKAAKHSTAMLGVSDQHAAEIRDTGELVLTMANQIKQVSQSAKETAFVACQALAAAERGREAVQNSISGMNGIREQIQETAKRIKRLGESSQEIGEIVELISDITEQTNTLALNAAIQAAAAGEAGRGFTVIAEEVQRLAERSAGATRQIANLIKAIQGDTHDAVAAMERSTQGVVQGARVSDEAGNALVDIGRVSDEAAEMIMSISRTTQQQAESAELVAQSIQRILLVTEQTSDGTQKTAGWIRQLSGLSNELKNSVSRFRVE